MNNTIAFIYCYNDIELLTKSKSYLAKLVVPPGMTMEIINLVNQTSLTSAYNIAMNMSKSKYKVYLHQDVFINNTTFISDLLSIFAQDTNIGMVGMIGSITIPSNGVWWKGEMIGKVYGSPKGRVKLMSYYNPDNYAKVAAIDGLLMATQYDITWNESFNGWHYYDMSQVQEFSKHGYATVIPNQIDPWVTHDCGIVNVSNGYTEGRQLFVKTYLK